MRLDVTNACHEVEAAKVHQFDLLFQSTKMIFELLCSKYGWDENNIKEYYPEQTIENAVKQGWKTDEKSQSSKRNSKWQTPYRW